ncbi:malto-oligosyltrehalose synthase [Aeromicrobium sp. IC_218]|uniref:malto-oligosyltrehalose synthase n=1 Tax=Aeromicrobium sp. IC_218 TaxID=2545468 RepID=UPI001040B71C|nr:malto-oligosyltrehalose synthase [Aeromicrobium sp. IC_218]TCI99059.1 malto-oligosyltrehalose synthase [Aeromicrobium sp. IC_218]
MTTPTSTYRLQLHPGFTLDDALEVVPYLHDLGVGALYLSPVMEATPGSTHGYDVTDPTRVRGELGGPDALRRLAEAARERGMGVVVDVVPNHMSVEVPSANPWFWDVLTHGRDSAYAHYFDVDWSRPRLLLPVLGDDADVAELRLEDGRLAYYDHRFPVAPGTEGGSPQDVHDRQHYELVGWRRGNAELGYRRFFDITSLAAVRVELEDVFDAVHGEILRWVEEGLVTGLRIDHPDGLADPTAYAQRLRERAPGAWIVVEKILHPGEHLPASWPVDGTTGYDALNEVAGAFFDPTGRAALAEAGERLGVPADFGAVQTDARRMVTDRILVAEVRRIAALLDGVDAEAARQAVAETFVAHRVYRSYLPEGADDWAAAIGTARDRRPDLAEALDALDAQVTRDPHGELATRVQQTSGMVVAKGTEDTTFYRATTFAAANEVGGTGGWWAHDREGWERAATRRSEHEPAAMTALTTHDTKRSEDTRARVNALSQLAEPWRDAVGAWSERAGLDEPSLDALAWQTLVAAWPASDDRLADYLLKAAREGKVRTTWTETDEAFEEQVRAWPARVREDTALVGEVEAFVDRLRPLGWSDALGQKLLQLAGPGVPDVYQGTELWDLSLVDPDNRRPVDYAVRRDLLAGIDAGAQPEVDDEGVAKLLLTARVLRLRRERPDLFDGFEHVPAMGAAAGHALAFRRHPDLVAVATVGSGALADAGGWQDAALELGAGTWTDVLTGREHAGPRVPLADLTAVYPVALVTRK